MFLVGLRLTVILSVPLFTFTQFCSVSALISVLFLFSLVRTVILSVPLLTFTQFCSVSALVSVLFLFSLVLEVGPSFVVAIVMCVVFGAL